MSEGLNKVLLFGNLGAEPELRQTQGGPMLKLRLATNEVYFDKDKNKHDRVEWHSIRIFGRRAEALAALLHKGEQVLVDGRLSTSSYEKEGQKHYKTDIVANDVYLTGPRRGGITNGALPPLRAPAELAPASIPF